MKCPLFTAGFLSKDKWKEDVSVDCLKEECAWWDKAFNRCSILTLATIFDDIRDLMGVIAAKIPRPK